MDTKKSPNNSCFCTKMDGEASMKPREQKVFHLGAGWKMLLFLILCLIQAANTLKSPMLVQGKPGGTVTIPCHYTPSPATMHQMKYWCRLQSPKSICHTIVSSNHYIRPDYQGRVALADFPWRGLFQVTLSQLSLRDVGQYRCGIGDRNNGLFLDIYLTISAGTRVPERGSDLLKPQEKEIVIPVCTVLVLLLIVVLVLLQRRLQRNRPAQKAERAPETP